LKLLSSHWLLQHPLGAGEFEIGAKRGGGLCA
jgi:hypothetical protein